MEEDKDVVEGGPQFVCQHPEFRSVAVDHGEDVFFQYRQAFSCQPYDVVVQLQGFRVASGVEPTQSTGADQLLGEEDGETEDLVEHGAEEWVGMVSVLGVSAEELLIHL